MTLVLIGPACEDLIIIGDKESSKVGGASFFQSFVYEEYYRRYGRRRGEKHSDVSNFLKEEE